MARQLPPVDDDVFEALQRLAEPLIDDVNSVLRRLLGLASEPQAAPGSATASTTSASTAQPVDEDKRISAPSLGRKSQRARKNLSTKKRGPAKPRAARGTLLPEQEYELPLLRALDRRGGSAPVSAVIDDVGAALTGQLTDADQEVLDSGLTRWKNRVQFVRLKLVQAGQLKKGSPRGIWEITPAGRERVNSVGSNE